MYSFDQTWLLGALNVLLEDFVRRHGEGEVVRKSLRYHLCHPRPTVAIENTEGNACGESIPSNHNPRIVLQIRFAVDLCPRGFASAVEID